MWIVKNKERKEIFPQMYEVFKDESSPTGTHWKFRAKVCIVSQRTKGNAIDRAKRYAEALM